MEEFLHFLQGEMPKPGVISWFHLIALIPIIFSAIFVPYKFKNCSEKVYKNILYHMAENPFIFSLWDECHKPWFSIYFLIVSGFASPTRRDFLYLQTNIRCPFR